jgi:hypothetical protein
MAPLTGCFVGVEQHQARMGIVIAVSIRPQDETAVRPATPEIPARSTIPVAGHELRGPVDCAVSERRIRGQQGSIRSELSGVVPLVAPLRLLIAPSIAQVRGGLAVERPAKVGQLCKDEALRLPSELQVVRHGCILGLDYTCSISNAW